MTMEVLGKVYFKTSHACKFLVEPLFGTFLLNDLILSQGFSALSAQI